MAKARIIIAEDEGIVAKDLKLRLEVLGYEVLLTTSKGEDVVKESLQHQPDIVLMDIGLKGELDGIQAASMIRELAEIPVVFMTAYSDDATINRAKVTGPFGYVLKPFEDRDLRTTIEMALFKHESDRKLKESEERYRLLFQKSPVGVVHFDTQLRITDCNDIFCGLHHTTRDSLTSADFRSLNDKRVLPAIEKAVRGEPGHYEGPYKGTPHDAELRVSLRTAPLFGVGEKVLGGVGIMEDITDLMRREALLDAVLNSLTTHIAVIDGKGMIVRVNAAWQQFSRQFRGADTAPGGDGLSYLDFCASATGEFPDDIQPVLDGIQSVLNGSAAVFTTRQLCSQGDADHWYLISVTPLKTGEGGAVITREEITGDEGTNDKAISSR